MNAEARSGMYPVLSEEVLFVEEDGRVFVALPVGDVRKLSRLGSAVWTRCTGGQHLESIVADVASEQGLPLGEALGEVFDLLQELQETGYIEVLAEPRPQHLDRWRLGVRLPEGETP